MDYKKDNVYRVSDDYYTVSLIDENSKSKDSLNNDAYAIEQSSYELKNGIDSVEKSQEGLIYVDLRGDYDLNKKLHDEIANAKDIEYHKEETSNNSHVGKRKDRSKKIKQFEISNSMHQYNVGDDFYAIKANKVNINANAINDINNSFTTKNKQTEVQVIPYIIKIGIVLLVIGFILNFVLTIVSEFNNH